VLHDKFDGRNVRLIRRSFKIKLGSHLMQKLKMSIKNIEY